jgi:hypothetical protein
MAVVCGAATSSKVQLASVEDVIPKLMDVEAEPPCDAVQAVVLALDVPITTEDDPHPLKMLTVAVLIRLAYEGETIAKLRNAIARNRRMVVLRGLSLYTRSALISMFGLNDPNGHPKYRFHLMCGPPAAPI